MSLKLPVTFLTRNVVKVLDGEMHQRNVLFTMRLDILMKATELCLFLFLTRNHGL